MSPELTVIIFTRDDAVKLERCLESWRAVTRDFEILVVDNHSQDDTAAVVDRYGDLPARRIALREDSSFSVGNNRGLAEARGEFVLFLNPDVEVHPAAIEVCLRHAGDPSVGVVGPRLIWATGGPQGNGWYLPEPTQLLRERLRLSPRLVPPQNARTPVGWLMGCFLLGRREVFEQVGGFDEAFWFHGTDLEFCARIGSAGLLVVRVEAAAVLHVGHQGWSEQRRRESRSATALWLRRDRPGPWLALLPLARRLLGAL